MLKSRFTRSVSASWSEFLLYSMIIVPSIRYYDNKRSAEKKQHKTIEAADKVWTVLCILYEEASYPPSPLTVTLLSARLGHEICREENS